MSALSKLKTTPPVRGSAGFEGAGAEVGGGEGVVRGDALGVTGAGAGAGGATGVGGEGGAGAAGEVVGRGGEAG
ncbi:MAG: hypothetical protein A2V86_01360 [Deltaproteobacteria bacterium RBG_16_49_23]|nr:MAG: hypothetical protein A2V86_01360 [Deltaproteobacteria bacterium RBG_16_49_23]